MMSSHTRSGMCFLQSSATLHETNSDLGLRQCRAEPFIRHLVAFRLGTTCQKTSGSDARISAYDDADLGFQRHRHFPLSFAEIETCCQQHLVLAPLEKRFLPTIVSASIWKN